MNKEFLQVLLPQKIVIEQEIDLTFYDEIISFGDTKGDEAMFSISTKSNFRYFN